MKTIHRLAMVALLLACSGAATATSASLNAFHDKVMPVLVQVNSQGQVTSASPAIALSPKISRLLRTNLDEMISKPATDKQGHPIASQFIINLAVQAALLDNGKYAAHFTYLSTQPVPTGSWYWVHIDGHRLALARQGSSQQQGRFIHWNERREESDQRSYRQAPMPAIDRAERIAPAPHPGHGH